MKSWEIPKGQKDVRVNQSTWIIVDKEKDDKEVIEKYEKLHGMVNLRGVLVTKAIFKNHENT